MLALNSSTKFFVKKPSNLRRTFGLVKYISINRAKKSYLELSESEQAFIDTVNELFKSDSISSFDAENRIKKFISEHNQKHKLPGQIIRDSAISAYNGKIYSRFWLAKYEDKELVDVSSARYDFERALRALDTLAVDSEAKLIKNKLKSLKLSKAKRIYSRLNEIRSFLGMTEKVTTNKSELETISFITIQELHTILNNVEKDDVKLALATLFATGARLGELLALSEKDYQNNYILINKQIKPDGSVRLPKRQKTGKVVIVKELKPYVMKFLRIKNKKELRTEIYNTLTQVSNKVLERHIHPQVLRHSHAIHLLSLGASLTLISLQLRNRIEVCQRHYSGFEHTNDTLVLLNRIVGY